MSLVVSIGISLSISLGSGLSLSLPLDQGGGHMSEGSSGGPGEESRLDSAASGCHTVSGAQSNGGGGGGEAMNQRGVVEEGSSVDLSVDNSGSLDHRLDNWGVGNSANWGGKGSGEGGGEGGGEWSGEGGGK